jgi:hypothetical protein
MSDYRGVNRADGDERAQAHAASADYDVDACVADKPGVAAQRPPGAAAARVHRAGRPEPRLV